MIKFILKCIFAVSSLVSTSVWAQSNISGCIVVNTYTKNITQTERYDCGENDCYRENKVGQSNYYEIRNECNEARLLQVYYPTGPNAGTHKVPMNPWTSMAWNASATYKDLGKADQLPAPVYEAYGSQSNSEYQKRLIGVRVSEITRELRPNPPVPVWYARQNVGQGQALGDCVTRFPITGNISVGASFPWRGAFIDIDWRQVSDIGQEGKGIKFKAKWLDPKAVIFMSLPMTASNNQVTIIVNSSLDLAKKCRG